MDKFNIGKRESRTVDDKYVRGAKYLDDLELNEAIHFCYIWLNLPNGLSVLKHFDNILGDNGLTKIKVKRVKDEKICEPNMKNIKVKRIV